MLDDADKTLLRFAGISPGLGPNDEADRQRLEHLAELGLVEVVRRDSPLPGDPPLYRTTARGKDLLRSG